VLIFCNNNVVEQPHLKIAKTYVDAIEQNALSRSV